MRQLSFAVVFFTQASIGSAHAQTYPSRPVTLVLGFAAGGPSDVMARIFGKKLEQVLGQPVVIESRTGAGGKDLVSGRVYSSKIMALTP